MSPSITERETFVLKFGGTSVGTGKRLLEVSDIVKSYTGRTVVVLSAMSGSIKSQGTTSRLLEACQEVLKPNSQRYIDIVDSLEKDHLSAARDAFTLSLNEVAVEEKVIQNDGSPSPLTEEYRSNCHPLFIQDIFSKLTKNIKAECSKLRQFMIAAEVIDELSPRSQDFIISAGEKLSALIFASVLESQNTKAKYFSLDKIIQKKFDISKIDQTFYDYLVTVLREALHPYIDDHVCVVTGFLGAVPGGIISTIGRGYTDLTAALVAVAFKAHELHIWKEDPRKVPLAQKIHTISPEEAAELTYYGSEVIHPFTMEQVIRASIPIRIKNTFRPSGEGTIILPEGHPSTPSSSLRRATAVTIKDNVIVLNVHSNRKSVSHGFFAQIFLCLDQFGIVVDLISTSEVHISMALNPNVTADTLAQCLAELKKYGTRMAILSLVGKNMVNMVGVATKMFKTLAENGVNIEMISQGASEINISCVIDESRAVDALVAVHDALVVGEECK